MNKHARLPTQNRVQAPASASGAAFARPSVRYYAFLSYSHQDEPLADWLHRELERFRVPPALAGKLGDNGVIPERLRPIFRDRHELAAAGDLGEEIEEALAASQFLIVLCSPNAARSKWTNAEIHAFKRTRPDGCVLAAIAAGEPFASEIEGRQAEECFPPALREKYDRRGRPTGKRAEPLAADLRDDSNGRRAGLLKLIAGMLGVGLDDLVQREVTRRQRRLALLTAGSLSGMAIAIALAVTAIQARDSARDQRREAEGLVAFMLGDLKDRLEPIGRLDALDGVGSRVLAYYSKQDASDLSDAALLQRSRALSLSAEVANLRGDLATAQRLYREAAAGTAEAVRRDPRDPQRLFDHAQNIFYFGDLATQRGDYPSAETAFREYKVLADRTMSIEPNNLKWRMEVHYAETNLGIVLMKQRRFAEAAAQLSRALASMKAVAAVDPGNSNYQKSVAESLAWLADAELAEGRLADAIAHRKQHVALLAQLSRQSAGDVEYQQKLLAAQRSLGRLLAAHGDPVAASSALRSSIATADALMPKEPANTRWIDEAALSHLMLAQLLVTRGNLDEADAEVRTACSLAQSLLRRDQNVVDWQADQQTCLALRAEIRLARGDARAAEPIARQALALARRLKSGDRMADSYLVARGHQLVGDVERQLGQSAAAKASWDAAYAALPNAANEKPWETATRAQLAMRRGDAATASRLAMRLKGMGFKDTEVLKI